MEIILVVIAIVGLIIALAVSYKDKNNLQANFELKVKELDAKDNTINTQKAELANRKEQIESQKRVVAKVNDDLELLKAALDSKREELDHSIYRFNSQNSELTTLKDELTQLNARKKTNEIAIANLTKENAELKTQNESKEQNLLLNRDGFDKLVVQLSESTKEIESLSKEIATLKEELEKSQEDNKQLLTQLTPKKNGKRNPKN